MTLKKLGLYVIVLVLTLFIGSMALSSTLSIRPSLQMESLNYSDPLSPVVNKNLWSLREILPGKWKINNNLKFEFSARAQQDPTNESSREQYFGDLTEAYLEYRSGYYRLQAGQILYTWTGTDGFNPVDVVNSRRYFDPIRSDKLGSLSVSARGGDDFYDWQLIFIPQQTKSILPGENSRWLPRDVYVPPNSIAKIILPSYFNYTYSSDMVLDRALDNNYGARLAFHLGGLDLALMEFEGSCQTPGVVPTANTTVVSSSPMILQAQSDLSLQPYYYRVRTSGFTAVIPWEGHIFRVVSAYNQPLSTGLDIPGWNYNIVFSVERTMALGQGTLTFVPQYSYGKYQTAAGNEVTSLSRIFDSALLFGLRYSPSENWTFLASYLYDFLQSNQFGNLEVTKNLNDHFKIMLTGQIIMAPQGTTLGSYQRNGRVIGDLIWQL